MRPPGTGYHKPSRLPSGFNVYGGAFYRGFPKADEQRFWIHVLRTAGVTVEAIAKELRVAKSTVSRTYTNSVQYGTLAPLPRIRSGQLNGRSKIRAPEALFIKVYLIWYPRSYLLEVRDALYYYLGVYVTESTLAVALKRMRYTNKKRVKCAAEKYTPLNLLLDYTFRLRRRAILARDTVVIDEVMVHDLTAARLYGYKASDQRHVDIDKKSMGSGVMFIVAVTENGVLPVTLPVPQPAKVTAHLFEVWCAMLLIPALRPGMTVVMDNARVHRPKVLRRLFAMFGISLLFLPPWSPEYSPAEYTFSYLHLSLARDINRSRSNLIIETLNALHSTPAPCLKGWFKHCGWV